MRESLGIVIPLGGVVVVTRIIGPYDFGLYASAVAFVAVLSSVAQLGVEVRLISNASRRRSAPIARRSRCCSSAPGWPSSSGWVGCSYCERPVVCPPYTSLFELLLVSIPINICWAPAQARLERAFRYRRLAYVELGGDVVLYGVSVPLAVAGYGAWAPTAGYLAWQTFLFVASLSAARVAPRLAWDPAEARRMLRFGGGYGLATSVASVAGLVNPIVVGNYLGPTGVGYVAVASRLAATVGFVNRAVWRLSVAPLGGGPRAGPRGSDALAPGHRRGDVPSGCAAGTSCSRASRSSRASRCRRSSGTAGTA